MGPLWNNLLLSCVGDASSSSSSEEEEETTGEDEVDMDNRGGTISKRLCILYTVIHIYKWLWEFIKFRAIYFSSYVV